MFDDRDPIYRQIADQIRQDVVAGTLMEDEPVMSTNQYATEFRINPATAAKAFAELVAEGVLYKRRGVGTFVAPGARDRLVRAGRARFFTAAFDPLIAEARRLGIPLADLRAHLDEVERRDGAGS